METTRITFYDLTEFGFYEKGGVAPAFGDVANVLSELGAWARGQQIGTTKVYEENLADLLPAYFLDARRHGQMWLLSLWNSTPTVDGAVASVSAFQQVGTNEVNLTALADGAIPGFATYFWFVPDRNVVATIRFTSTGNGRPQMRLYLREFMRWFSSHAISEVDATTGTIVVKGYRLNAQGNIIKARPRVTMDIHKRAGSQQPLLDRSDRIRKVLKRTRLDLVERRDRALWQRILTSTHLSAPDVRPHEVKLSYALEVSGLTTEEVGDLQGRQADTMGAEDEYPGEHWISIQYEPGEALPSHSAGDCMPWRG